MYAIDQVEWVQRQPIHVGFTEDADGNVWPLYGPSPQAFARKRESAGPLKLDDLLHGIDVGGNELTFTAVAGHENSAGNGLRKFIGLNVKATAPFWQLSHDVTATQRRIWPSPRQQREETMMRTCILRRLSWIVGCPHGRNKVHRTGSTETRSDA
jgi:hypothetical protein